jgi:diguanylate cyclase (GGDEF)-like protein
MVAALGTLLSIGRFQRANDADILANEVAQLRGLVHLQRAVLMERTMAEFLIRPAALGLDRAAVEAVLQLDLPKTPEADTDRQLATISDPPFSIAILHEVRAKLAAHKLSALDDYEKLNVAADHGLNSLVVHLQGHAAANQLPEIQTQLNQLLAATEMSSAALAQVNRVEAIWVNEAPSDADRRALAESTQRVESAYTRLRNTYDLPADVNARLADAHRTVATGIQTTIDGKLNVTSLANHLGIVREFAQAHFDRNDELATLAEGTAATLRTTALDMASQNRLAFLLTAGSCLLVLVITLVVTSWIARSISRPVRRITDAGTRLKDGHFHGTPVAEQGPHQLADLARLVNMAQANFALLSKKLAALAGGANQLDDSDPLPGELGEHLEQSMLVLRRSVEERERLASRLEFEATHDSLTGMLGRTSALQRLDGELAAPWTDPSGPVLLFVDLDDFKRLNDAMGHTVGDEMLTRIAERIDGVRRSTAGAWTARFEGDEFLMVLPSGTSSLQATDVAHDLRTAIRADLWLSTGATVSVDASIGVAIADHSTTDSSDLLRDVDVALFEAKRRSEHVALFDDELRNELARTRQIQEALRAALQDGTDLRLEYQPLIAADTQLLRGVEVLVRWDNPFKVGPDVFVPIAERAGLIVELDTWVMRTAFAEAVRWNSDPRLANLPIAVNISGHHLLHPELIDNVYAALLGSGMDPRRITIEVTETALVNDLARAAQALESLRSLGVRTAIDDFGTGYTSISQIRALPIDEIKIDRSLVNSLPNHVDGELVRIVQNLADHLGLRTVAEGVEEADQAGALCAMGCDTLQGWHFARSMPATDLAVWAESRRETLGALLAAGSDFERA